MREAAMRELAEKYLSSQMNNMEAELLAEKRTEEDKARAVAAKANMTAEAATEAAAKANATPGVPEAIKKEAVNAALAAKTQAAAANAAAAQAADATKAQAEIVAAADKALSGYLDIDFPDLWKQWDKQGEIGVGA